ncbi:adenylate cyclase type 3-like [Haliotis rubra]|uniref:adenylate cyclase type 3-like n=1 Tax=Haliotis rubra TaxID=36100 RepID=UPI001EE5E3D5|nr:adenylate cyclase type 3-like [Haliotis rubra]
MTNGDVSDNSKVSDIVIDVPVKVMHIMNARVGPLKDPEVMQNDPTGRLFTHFRNNMDEKLYRIYYKRQKLDLIDSFVFFSSIFDVYVLVMATLKYSENEITKIAIVALLLFVNIIIFVLCHIQRISVAVRSNVAYVIWMLLIIQIFFDLSWNSNSGLPSEGVTWIVVLVYLTYVMLPVTLALCILLACLFSVGHVCAVSIIWTQNTNNVTLLGNQVGANILLVTCSHALGIMSYVFLDKQQRRSFVETKSSLSVKVTIEKESKQQERLLLSVLPKHVAGEMLRDWGEGADGQFRKIFLTRYENVSILFADIVGFTAISSSCTAAELVKTLNELFANFDKLANKFHQHRIKILGDCYYCVCGAPDPRPDHAVLCVHMGLNVVDAITYVREKTKRDVNMRVGIHTGAVLGGVLGQKQWQYDVLGKEVILANKMESGGVPGRVHISETTKSFLHDEFELERGNGDQREDYIRLLGLKTYLIKSVLKPLQPEQVNGTSEQVNGTSEQVNGTSEQVNGASEHVSGTSFKNDKHVTAKKNGFSKTGSPGNNPSLEQEDGILMNTYETSGQREDGDFGGDGGKLEQRLQEALLERDNERGVSKQLHHLSMRFADRKLESRYQGRREQFSDMASLGLCLVALFTFLARLCVLPVTFHALYSFIIGMLILVAMTTFTMAVNHNAVSKEHNIYIIHAPAVYCASQKEWEKYRPRILWTGFLVLVLTATDVVDMFGCAITNHANTTSSKWMLPSDPTCKYPPYFIHTGSLVLMGIASLVQIGQFVKLVLVVSITTLYCVLDIVVMPQLFDSYDITVYSQYERDSVILPSKYRLTAALIAVAVAVIFFGRRTDSTSRSLFLLAERADKQKEQVTLLRMKNEALVYNLLPGHVAKDFLGSQKKDDELYSNAYDEVGVIFAACPNFHNFYNESAVNNNGLECFRFLNEIISDYDELLEQDRFSSICKIKTVGPTYMAASGMTGTVHVTKCSSLRERWKHLDDLVQFAFAMKETLRKINEQSFNNFILRIGINHGPVIAGVIGARKPHYDIWGNTVNVSSRMESTGHAGKIQVVEETMAILKEFGYMFQKRGLIKVKGKGELMTYFVENRTEDDIVMLNGLPC